MKQIIETLKSHKHAVIWTICYVCIMWAILYFMFNFNLFSMHQWHRLLRAELHGFAGFVFGILMLAALPLYVASTTLIIRTKKPLITIQFPKIKIPQFLQPKKTGETAPRATTPAASETPSLGPDEENTPAELPEDLPAELRIAFIRARNKIGTVQTSIFNSIDKQPAIQVTDTPTISSQNTEPDTLPLPTDFDIEIPDESPVFTDFPTFTEINFDTPDTESEPTPEPKTPESNFDTLVDNSEIINHLTTTGTEYTTHEEFVITPTHVITTHSDPNFWVADTDNWFASGAVRPSPIKRLKSISESENLTPVLYLAATNIMDLEKLQPEWESAGIRIITSVSDL
ncbi:MAG: hypothetical protein IKW57_01585 [Alphaproteobacteria bacterium]|nr:hypothetical protein [Alphaproteobacteria bacterium]